jgi:hypothetical protein
MAKAAVCTFCNGPLVTALGNVTCSYCGKPNNPTGLPSRTQMRQVVREVVNEDLNHNGIPDALERSVHPQQHLANALSPAPARTTGIILGCMASVVLAAGLGAFLIARSPAPRYVPPTRLVDIPVPSVVPPIPLKIPDPPIGSPQAYWMDKEYIYTANQDWLIKADRSTLAVLWKSRRSEGSEATLVRLVGDRVFVGAAKQAEFYAADSGKQTGTYQFRDASFPPNAACVVGNQILIDTSFQPRLRLDATTAKKTSGKGNCSLASWRYISCPFGQTCTQTTRTTNDMRCSATLAAKGVNYWLCETDDGSAKRRAIVALSGSKTLWTSESTDSLAGEAGFMGIVDGTLVVGTQSTIEGFDPSSGKQIWRNPGATFRSIVHSDASNLFYADDKTFNLVAAKTGKTIAKLDGRLFAEDTQ